MSVEASIEAAPRTRRRPMSRRTKARIKVIAGVIVVGGLVLAALWAPLPYDPTTPHPLDTFRHPGGKFWFGTDDAGLDVFSRTIAAAKTDVPVALAGVLMAGIVGTPLGVLLSIRNKFTELLMRLLDLFQALPLLIVTIVLVAVSGNGGSLLAIIIAIALANTPLFIRLVRAEALTVRARRFVEAAEGFGASMWRVSFRHIMPNVMPIALAQFSISSGFAIIVIAALGYLGIGARPPTPTWGSMINDGAQFIGNGDWWLLTFPAIAISVMVISLNVIADGLRSMLTEPADDGRRARKAAKAARTANAATGESV
jgi:peptide/nickel transport system permease protein